MKKVTLILSTLLGIMLFMVSIPGDVFSQTFKSEAEIDAYYDQQIRDLEARNAQKNRAVHDNLQRELDSINRKYESELKQAEGEIFQALEGIFGDHYEGMIQFLDYNTPNPNDYIKELLETPEKQAMTFISNVALVNPKFATELKALYDNRTRVRPAPKATVLVAPVSKQKVIKTPSAGEIFLELDSSITIADHIDRENKFSELKETNPGLYKEVFRLAENKYFKGKTDPAVMTEYMDSISKEDFGYFMDKLQIFNPNLKDKVMFIINEKYPNGIFSTNEQKSESIAPTSTPSVPKILPQSRSFAQKTMNFFNKLKFW